MHTLNMHTAGFGWGVWGSGLATTLAQYVSCSALCVLLVRKGMLRLPVGVGPGGVRLGNAWVAAGSGWPGHGMDQFAASLAVWIGAWG